MTASEETALPRLTAVNRADPLDPCGCRTPEGCRAPDLARALAETKARAEAAERERDALAATVKELLGCLASADWDSHEMDDARRLLESLSSPKPSIRRCAKHD